MSLALAGSASGCAPKFPGDPFTGERVTGDMDALDEFARALGGSPDAQGSSESGLLPRRINANKATIEQDLAKLVLSLMDLVRQLMERQAVRRVNAGSLTDDEVEQMGETFLRLDRKMSELREVFGLRREDLNLNLGAVRELLQEAP